MSAMELKAKQDVFFKKNGYRKLSEEQLKVYINSGRKCTT